MKNGSGHDPRIPRAKARAGVRTTRWRFQFRTARTYVDRLRVRISPAVLLPYLWRNPLFDASWYLEKYPDVRETHADPERHYRRHGVREGRDPNAYFHTAWYLATNPDVATGRLNPLDHYYLFGAVEGRDPSPLFGSRSYVETYRDVALFSLELHQGQVSSWDQRRADGKPVILIVSHRLGGGTDRHIRDLQSYLSSRCHIFALAPAALPVVDGRNVVSLRPLDETSGALLFDATAQLDDLVMVLRAIGVERVHVHHRVGNEAYLSQLLEKLAIPYDVTLHDYHFLAPQPHLVGEDGTFVEPSEASSPVLTKGTSVDSLEHWRDEGASVLKGADRVIAPSVDTASRVGMFFPGVKIIAAAHPYSDGLDQLNVIPIAPREDEPLRIAVIGNLLVHKGSRQVQDCADLAKTYRMPLEFHVIGHAPDPIRSMRGAPLVLHGRYRDDRLQAILQSVRPHLAWFPAQWPETFCYTLSEAMIARLPVMASSVGAFPERLGGRPWTWLVPWDSPPSEWCRLLTEAREALITGTPPPLPPGVPKARVDFYESSYLAFDGSAGR